MQTEEVSLCEIFYQKNEISQVLQVSISQLTTYLSETTRELISTPGRSRKVRSDSDDTKKDLKQLEQLNMLLVDNKEN